MTFPGPRIAALEAAVRPFLANPPRAAELRPEPAQDDGAAVLVWTARMPVQVTSIAGLGFSVRWDDDERASELARTTHQVRVSNPADAEQFVDVEVIDDVTFDVGRGRKRRYQLDN